MSKKSQKEAGWIETIYGDYWSKRKKIIIAGFFLPLLFCFFTYVEFSYILSWIYNTSFDLQSLFYEIITQFGQNTLLYLFLILVACAIILSQFFTSFLSFPEEALQGTHREIFIEKKSNPRSILMKNIFVSALNMSSEIVDLFISFLALAILFIPALLVGYVAYIYINLFSIPTLITNISLLPTVGEPLQDVAIFITETIGKEITQISTNMSPLLVALILTIPIILVLAISDLIQSKVLRKQRGSIREILKNGTVFIIFNANFSGKIGGFIHTTLLCLFTQQGNLSFDIPIINDRNVDEAFQSVLGTDQQCYVLRVPRMSPTDLIQELEKLPKSLQDEIKETLKAQMRKW